MSTSSESDRIAAAGAPITLADGRTVHVRYSLRSLKLMEDRWGSIANLDQVVEKDEKGRLVGASVEPLTLMLSYGLLHEGLAADELLDLLRPKQMGAAWDAVNAALAEAFGDSAEKTEEVEAGNPPSPNGSPGSTGTTSSRSLSVAPTTSSGP